MKRITKRIIAVSLVLAFVVCNLAITLNKENARNKNLSLSNIKSLQASAGEMYCDQSNDTPCRIEAPGGTGHSKGYLVLEY